MAARGGFHGPRPGRVIGLYALATMDREGPVYGYQLAERIEARTEGAWRPGAGAIYPALAALAERGMARSVPSGGRRVYAITPRGRAFLTRIRRSWIGAGGAGPDLSRLWAEISGAGDTGQHLLRHLRRHLDGIAAMLERDPRMTAGSTGFRDQVLAELRVSETRLSALAPAVGTARARRRRRSA
jgi:DNA-binding PadR family transcriptional regulator